MIIINVEISHAAQYLVETDIFYFQDSQMNRKFKRTELFEI